jgi:hypothetical protein
VVWTHRLGDEDVVRSIVATPDHLLFCISTVAGGKRTPVWERHSSEDVNKLVALKRKDGEEVWSQKVDRPGNLALANGFLFFTDGDLHVLGPAEKTARAEAR